jgi:cell shape-determining protein MreC
MIIEKLKGVVRYLAYNDYATELDNLRLENKRLREKLRMYKSYLRAANKGAERNAMVSQLSAARNSQLCDRIRELQKRPDNELKELRKENTRLRDHLTNIANMPEYDQDDAHRIRYLAKIAL